jgi:hypothetical protein
LSNSASTPLTPEMMSMIANSIWGLPLRNISMMATAFPASGGATLVVKSAATSHALALGHVQDRDHAGLPIQLYDGFVRDLLRGLRTTDHRRKAVFTSSHGRVLP